MVQCDCGGEMYESRDVLTVRLTSKGKPHVVQFHNLKCWRCKGCDAHVWDSDALAKQISEFRAFLARRRYERRKEHERQLQEEANA